MIATCRFELMLRGALNLALFTAVACSESNPEANGGTGGRSSTAGGGSAAGGVSNVSGGSPSGGAVGLGGSATGGTVGQVGGTASGGAASGGAASGGTTAGSGSGGVLSAGGANATGGSGTSGGASSGGSGVAGSGGAGKGGTAGTGGGSAGSSGTGGSGNQVGAVRVIGRTAPGSTAGSVRFSWPGVHIRGRFSGTQVSMDLSDGSNKNRFTVVVDGGAPKTVTTTTATSLSLATGLPNGTHEILIWRNTEVGFGVTQFNGLSSFGSGGALLAPAAAPDRRIEVIGDSLSAGAGVEGDAACAGGIDSYTNNYLAYGSVAARAVAAEVVTIAWSGIGVFRNCCDTGPTMPQRYPYSVSSTNTAWDFSLYQPQVVVINLGTNDFGPGDPGTPYETAYVDFVKSVRTKYANASFVLIDMYGGNRQTRIDNVVLALKSGGESKVEMLSVNSAQNNLGCGQHPNVAGQAAMGAVLATRLKSLMNW